MNSIKPSFTESFTKCRVAIDWRMKDIEQIYNENYLNYTGDRSQRIPKIIHYIWTNAEPLPPNRQKLIDIWKEDHPQWEFKLWDEDAVKKFGLENHELYQRITDPDAKSNIIRFEVLNRYGGVYIDTDFLSVKPLDDLLYLKFFLGYGGQLDQVVGPDKVMQNLVASCPNNDMLKNIINKTKTIMSTPTITPGQKLVSDVLMDELDPELTVLFPQSYFYPFDGLYANEIRNCKIPKLLNFIWKFASVETYTIHLSY